MRIGSDIEALPAPLEMSETAFSRGHPSGLSVLRTGGAVSKGYAAVLVWNSQSNTACLCAEPQWSV